MSISNNDLEKDPYFEQSYFDWNAFFIQFMAGVLYVLPNVAYAAVFFFGGTVLVFGVMSLITYPFTRAQQKAMLRTKKADTIWKVASFILWYGSSAMFLLIEPILNRPISSVNFLWFLNVAPLRFVGMTWLSPVIVISLATIVLLYFIKKGRNGKVLDKGISKAEPGPVDNGAPGDLDLMVPPS